jgi:hypothetical protein
MTTDLHLHSVYEGRNRKTTATFLRSDPPLVTSGRALFTQLLDGQVEARKDQINALPAVIAWRALAKAQSGMSGVVAKLELELDQAQLDRRKAITNADIPPEERAAAITAADTAIDDLEERIEATKAGEASAAKDLAAAEAEARAAVLKFSQGINETISKDLKARTEKVANDLKATIAPALDAFGELGEADRHLCVNGGPLIESSLLKVLDGK